MGDGKRGKAAETEEEGSLRCVTARPKERDEEGAATSVGMTTLRRVVSSAPDAALKAAALHLFGRAASTARTRNSRRETEGRGEIPRLRWQGVQHGGTRKRPATSLGTTTLRRVVTDETHERSFVG